jgi:dGTPase
LKTIYQLISEEDSKLSPLAVFNQDTIERVFPEELHPYRLPLHRDRDRILHSWAFKRLEYKTQVFINSEGDNFRTRLTHSLEVAGVARTITYALGLNSFLSEVIALAHDLGHTPFGHAGQDILNELMKPYGGFEHNKQSLRIVQKLENRYPNFPGLNLTRMTLIGLMKHGADYQASDLQILRTESGPSLESIITDLSDEIAYSHHDIEDGLERNLINEEMLSELTIWKRNAEKTKQEFPKISSILGYRKTIRSMMNEVINDFILNIEMILKNKNIKKREDFTISWKSGERIIQNSDSIAQEMKFLKSFLFKNLYHHPQVVSNSEKGQIIIEFLFKFLFKNPDKIPDTFYLKNDEELPRIVADYISGMTDRYAEIKAKEFGFSHI